MDKKLEGVGAIAVLVFGLVCAGALCMARVNAPPPEEAAKAFLESLGLDPSANVTCVPIDTDGDGYVSCTVNERGVLTPIECSVWGAGCRMQKPGARPVLR